MCGKVSERMKADLESSLIASCRKTIQNHITRRLKPWYVHTFLYYKAKYSRVSLIALSFQLVLPLKHVVIPVLKPRFLAISLH